MTATDYIAALEEELTRLSAGEAWAMTRVPGSLRLAIGPAVSVMVYRNGLRTQYTTEVAITYPPPHGEVLVDFQGAAPKRVAAKVYAWLKGQVALLAERQAAWEAYCERWRVLLREAGLTIYAEYLDGLPALPTLSLKVEGQPASTGLRLSEGRLSTSVLLPQTAEAAQAIATLLKLAVQGEKKP